MLEKSQVQPRWLSLPRHRWSLIGGLACLSLLGVGLVSLVQEPQMVKTQPVPAKVPAPTKITALGRLEPQGEVFTVSSSGSGSTSDRVAQVLVEEGSQVNAGQVIAILDSRDSLQAVFEKAKAEVQSLDAQLRGDKAVQIANVERLNANLRVARKDCQRYETLNKAGAVSAQERDSFCLQAETASDSLDEGRANLNRIITTGEKRLITAKAAQRQAYAELMLSYIRAPKAGEILKVHTKPGELIGAHGIVEMGQTNQMVAVAEIYESDITKVKSGQAAIVTSEALPDTLRGEVVRIGRLVTQQKILDPNPTADSDARIVEVKILLDPASSDKAKGLTNQRIRAVITI